MLDAFFLEGYRDKAEVWISNRTDGLGSGTEADPFSGATGTGPQIQVSLTNDQSTLAKARVALATTSQALGLVNGDVVTIRNATGEDAKYWNGSFPIYDLSPDGKSFKYWMARKGDDVIHPGTIQPPDQSGSPGPTAAKMIFQFDEVMRRLSALPNTHMQIFIGAGTFLTRGYSDIAQGVHGWEARTGMKFRGSGMDITILRLVYAQVSGGNYFAISAPTTTRLDYVEVSDLTVDSNLPGQPITRNFDYAEVAASAIFLNGSFCRISRCKAINWGTQTAGAEAFILGVGSTPTEGPAAVSSIIEDCICVKPNENNRRETTIVTTSGGGNSIDQRLGFSQGLILRRNFIDCEFSNGRSSFYLPCFPSFDTGQIWRLTSFRPHGLSAGNRVVLTDLDEKTNAHWNDYYEVVDVDEDTNSFRLYMPTLPPDTHPPAHNFVIGALFQALAMGATQGGIVEDNAVFNAWTGGPYNDTGDSHEIIVRRNRYFNVAAGPSFNLGGLSRGPRKVSLKSLGEISSGVWRVEATYIGTDEPYFPYGHGYGQDQRIKISSATDPRYDRQDLIITPTGSSPSFTFEFPLPSEPTAAIGLAEAVTGIIATATHKHVGNGIAEAGAIFAHLLQVGDVIFVSNATLNPADNLLSRTLRPEFNGFFEITEVPDPLTFRYQMKSVPEANAIAYNGTYQRVWGVRRLVVEDNIFELRQAVNGADSAAFAIGLNPNNRIMPPAGPPPYVFGEVVVRRNIIRMVHGIMDPSFVAAGILVANAKKLIAEDNIVDVPVLTADHPNVHWYCGKVKYQNNRTSGGKLIQGFDGVTSAKLSELETEIDDAMLMAVLG